VLRLLERKSLYIWGGNYVVFLFLALSAVRG